MTTTIYKYPIPLAPRFSVAMPKGAVLLYLQVQHGRPCLWARVDPEAEACERLLCVVGTGHPIEDDMDAYVGTWLQDALVWHLFDRGERAINAGSPR